MAIESIVRKFYANVPSTIDNVVIVWDILVPFRPNDINAQYYFMNIRHGEYETYLSNADYARVLETLTLEEDE